MFLLETDSLSYRYPESDKTALHKVSIKIPAGQFIALIGANNCGKSTLCCAFAGVVPHLHHGQMEGRVLINRTDSKDQTVSEIARHVGFVLQVPTRQMSGVRYTVFEEVAFGLENQGVAIEEMRDQVAKMLTLMGLEEYASRSPFQLSGGQQQRLALATVLAVDPEILVLDEPTTFLDPQGAKLLFDILHQLQQQGKTIIVAEQRLDLIAEYADRVLAFENGHLLLDGSPREILTSPAMRSINLDWTRYTHVANLARRSGLLSAGLPLPASLRETVDVLSHRRKSHAHSHP